MKTISRMILRIYLPVIAFLLNISVIDAQCPDGDVSILNSNEMAAFLETYPNCEEIQGSLKISSRGNQSITSIYAFKKLKYIKGQLEIIYNSRLNSLRGLENLVTVEGGVFIQYNGLQSLNGIQNVKSVKGQISIVDNSFLTSLNGIDSLDLTEVEQLTIRSNKYLSACNLYNICDYLTNGGNATIYDNSKDGCYGRNMIMRTCGVEELCPELDITFSNQAEIDLYKESFSHCTQLSNLIIRGEDVVDLTAFENIQVIDKVLAISNTQVENLSSFKSLKKARDFVIASNTSLSSMSNLKRLEEITRSLKIKSNPKLRNLEGLANTNKISHINEVEVISNFKSIA